VPQFFSLVHLTNTGAAFSMFSDSNLFFIALSSLALVVLAVCALRGMIVKRLTRIALALLGAGILGNLSDRIIHGHVVDFLLFDLHVRFANPWPAFNVADSCICVAAGLIFVQSFLEARAEKRGV
jgi:signal peptidase II